MKLDGEQYKIIVESSPNMIWRSGTDTLCNYFNKTWLSFTGKSMEEEMGNGWASGVHPEDLDVCIKIYMDNFVKQEPFEMEYRLKRHDGAWRWINDRGVPYYNAIGEFSGYIGSCMDVTGKVEGEKLREMAQTDGLTKINNRQYFEYLARIELAKAQRDNTDLYLIVLDVDKFKIINDQYGHLAGDLVLKEIAKILVDNLASIGTVGRFGGDEFIAIASGVDENVIYEVIEKCKKDINQDTILYENNKICFSATFGIIKRSSEISLEKLIYKADNIMYTNKKN